MRQLAALLLAAALGAILLGGAVWAMEQRQRSAEERNGALLAGIELALETAGQGQPCPASDLMKKQLLESAAYAGYDCASTPKGTWQCH